MKRRSRTAEKQGSSIVVPRENSETMTHRTQHAPGDQPSSPVAPLQTQGVRAYHPGARGPDSLALPGGRSVRLPIFIPVFNPRSLPLSTAEWRRAWGIEGCIVNAFLLYMDRVAREQLLERTPLHEFLGFDGFIMTDSGAFQGFRSTLHLKNKDIVRFQDQIGSDVVAPLDLVTPPGDSKKVAEMKLHRTNDRIEEAMAIVQRGVLAGVQQGGRFLDLRKRSAAWLAEKGLKYVAIGSLVPFFNKRHDMSFAAPVIRDARAEIGPGVPMHVFGAGDPCELPMLVHAGADIFDSSSYGHYAAGGWYMSRFGSIKDTTLLRAIAEIDGPCPCPSCGGREDVSMVILNPDALLLHNLWTILDTMRRIRESLAAGTLESMIAQILSVHSRLFPDSLLKPSWDAMHG